MDSTASAKAYQYLYHAILNKTLPMGAPIIENEIAAMIGVSRSPIREALKRLDAEGLVNSYPNKGCYVAHISVKDAQEMLVLRAMFELQALRTSYLNIPTDVLDMIIERVTSLPLDADSLEYYTVNHLVHDSIVQHSYNNKLISFYEKLMAQLAIAMAAYAKTPENYNTTRESHLKILGAIRQRNFPAAESYLQRHIMEGSLGKDIHEGSLSYKLGHE